MDGPSEGEGQEFLVAVDPKKVQLAVLNGLSIVCATCENYWKARDVGLEGDQCLAKTPCGSPIAGDVFHEYIGPMTAFDRWCFACGAEAAFALRVKSMVRVIGCCAKHIELVRTLKPESKDAISITVYSKDGEGESDKLEAPKPMIKFRM